MTCSLNEHVYYVGRTRGEVHPTIIILIITIIMMMMIIKKIYTWGL